MNEKHKSVKLNMIMNALLTMSSLVFPLITFPYVSRILLPEGTGKVSFAVSLVSYFSMFAQLGIPTYGIKACAKVQDDKEELSRIVHELLIINIVMTLFAYVMFAIAMLRVPRLYGESKLFWTISVTIFLNATGVEWLYKGLEKYTYITIRSVIFKFIALIVMFIFVKQQSDYVIYGFITIFAASASNILNFINLRKIIYIKPVGKYNFKRHIKMILVFFSMSVATTIYTNLDNVMLGFIKGDTEVGYYSAAVKIKMILVSLVTSASAVLLPRASYYVDKKMYNEFYRIIKKTMSFIILIAVPFATYFIIFAEDSILFLSGKDYAGAIIPMQIIMPTLLLIGITNVTGIQMMVPLGLEKQVLYSEIIGAIVDLLLNCICIPRFGASGAAFGTLIAEVMVLLYQSIAIRNLHSDIFKSIPYLKILFATMCGMTASVWVSFFDFGVFQTLLVSAICFFGCYIFLLTLTKESLVLELEKQVIDKLKRSK